MPSEDGQQGFDRIFETMPPEARTALRRRVLAEIEPDARLRSARRFSARALAVYLAASITASGVAYAASGAQPGDALFPVKIAVEEMAIAAAPTEEMREDLQERSALRRADEIGVVIKRKAAAEDLDEAVGRFEEAAARALASEKDGQEAEKRLREHVERVPERANEQAKRALKSAKSRSSSGKSAKKTETAKPNGRDGKKASRQTPSSSGESKVRKK